MSGKYVVNEEFGEINLPIVTARNGLSFINRLEELSKEQEKLSEETEKSAKSQEELEKKTEEGNK